MYPLLVSFGYYAYVFISCELIRKVSAGILGKGSTLHRCLLEFLGTLQICTCIFEGSIVSHYYGQIAYFFTVAGVIWVHCHIKRAGIHSNPSSLFEEWLTGGGSLRTPKFLLLLGCECAAGFAAFYAARLFWRLEFLPEHGERFRSFACRSEVAVPLGLGMWYEGAATLWDRLFWLLVEARQPEERAIVLGSLEVATTTIMGLSYTGMYFNPILASTMTLGCPEAGLAEHFLVYWAGPFVGQLLGTAAFAQFFAEAPPPAPQARAEKEEGEKAKVE